jgi:mRNA-capping enzyme
LKLGLWIDLTNTNRFYPRQEIEASGAIYTKLNCKGHGEAPQAEQIDAFVEVCTKFMDRNSTDYIGVHCTHGFNRSGFLVCCFLIREFDFSVMAALALFAKCRPPGIYKQDYINTLWEMFKDPHDPPPPQAPPLPDWCFDDTSLNDLPSTSWGTSVASGNGKRTYDQANGDDTHVSNGANGPRRRRGELVKENPTFMEGITGVEPIMNPAELLSLQRKVQGMCGWTGYVAHFIFKSILQGSSELVHF